MKLDQPPYLQIALDLIDAQNLDDILQGIPKNNKILLEAGTPTIKKFGINLLNSIKKYHPKSYIIADMKTLDVGWLEVQIAVEENANAVAVSGLAPRETIESALFEAKKHQVDIILDLMNVSSPMELLSSLSEIPPIVLFHRGIDQEGNQEHPWELISLIKQEYPNTLIAVAGGLNLQTSEKAIQKGADVIVIGRAITQADSIEETVNNFLKLL